MFESHEQFVDYAVSANGARNETDPKRSGIRLHEEVLVEPAEFGSTSAARESGRVSNVWCHVCDEGVDDSGGAGSFEFT